MHDHTRMWFRAFIRYSVKVSDHCKLCIHHHTQLLQGVYTHQYNYWQAYYCILLQMYVRWLWCWWVGVVSVVCVCSVGVWSTPPHLYTPNQVRISNTPAIHSLISPVVSVQAAGYTKCWLNRTSVHTAVVTSRPCAEHFIIICTTKDMFLTILL